jgi:hypothetical protein
MTSRGIAIVVAALAAALWGAVPAGASTMWRAQTVPEPTNSTMGLSDVSCPSTGVCMAVGQANDITTHAPFAVAEQRAAGRWTIVPTPSPDSGVLLSVSCLSATDCTAFGTRFRQGGEGTLAEHWDGSSWTIQASPNPAGATEAELDHGTCASPTSCTAVGTWAKTGTKDQPLAEHWDGSSWTITRLALPAGAGGGTLSGVSCASATDCTAVGEYSISSNPGTLALGEHWNGTRWTLRPMVSPAGAYFVFPQAVSCTGPKHCTAVGGVNTGSTVVPLVERWDGLAWTIQTDAAPAGAELTGVSCTSSSSCTAVGGITSDTGGAEHWDGTSWTLQTLPVAHKNASAGLAGVSCLSATNCTAVGGYSFHGGRGAHPLADHE